MERASLAGTIYTDEIRSSQCVVDQLTQVGLGADRAAFYPRRDRPVTNRQRHQLKQNVHHTDSPVHLLGHDCQLFHALRIQFRGNRFNHFNRFIHNCQPFHEQLSTISNSWLPPAAEAGQGGFNLRSRESLGFVVLFGEAGA